MPAVMHNCLTYSDTKVVRSVVLASDTYVPRDVYTATRTGSTDAVTTRQVIEDGDIVVVGTTDDGAYRTDIYIAKDTSKYPIALISLTKANEELGIDKLDITSLLKLFKHTSLIRWMSDITLPGLLPEGIGWDGNSTAYEREKYRNVETFLQGVDTQFLEGISKAVMFSPSSNITIDWNEAKVISSTDDLMFETCDTAENRFVVEWSNNVDFIKFKELGGFRSRRAYTNITSETEKVLLGTVKRNAYGLILQWSLYIVRDK